MPAINFKPLALRRFGIESRLLILDFFMWGSYSASLRNVDGSTQVPTRAWNNARKGTWGLPSPVKQKRRHMTYTYTVSMWRKTQTSKQTKLRHRCNLVAIDIHTMFILIIYNIKWHALFACIIIYVSVVNNSPAVWC
jgi:hypothetical protein